VTQLTRLTAEIVPGAIVRSTGPAPAAYWGRRLAALILLVWALSFVIGFQSGLVALAIIGFGATIIGLRSPTIGLFGIGILCTLDAILGPLVLTGGLLRWNTLNYWLIIVILLSLPFLLRLNDLHTRLLQLFLLLLTLELAISPDRMLGVQQVLSLISTFGLLVYFARAAEEKHIWYWVGMINGILAAGCGLVFYLQQDRLPYINPNVWAYVPLTGLLAICLGLPLSTPGWRGQMRLVLLGSVNAAWVFLSGSRGALLMTIWCLLFLVIAMRGLSNRFVFLIAAALLSLLMLTQFTDLQANTILRIETLLNPNLSPRLRTSGRYDLVLGGWYIFLDHPFGVGTGGYSLAWANLGTIEGLSGYGQGYTRAAHSGWIKTLSENGIPGLLLFACYVLSFTIAAWRRRRRDTFLLGLLLTITFTFACISIELEWAKGLWFLAAGVTTLLHREQIVAHLYKAARREPIHNILRSQEAYHD
jgi:O-antigen ligase/polysaccharide polymerase Wzy-like membrane protein